MNKSLIPFDRNIEQRERNDKELFHLTAVSSFYREEHGGVIGAKQILMPDIEPIRRHLQVHELCFDMIPGFLEGTTSLEGFIRRLHAQLLSPTYQMPIPGSLRRNMVVLTTYNDPQSNKILSAKFVCPNYDKIKDGLKLIEDRFRNQIMNKRNIVEVCGELHYLITVLHPFADGNGRIARTISLTILQHYGFVDISGFTFFSENYSKDGDNTVYNESFKTRNEQEIADEVKVASGGTTYKDEGGEKIVGIEHMDMQYYIDRLDLKSPVQEFEDILGRLENVTPLLVEFSRIIAYMKDHEMTRGKQNYKIMKIILDAVADEIKNGEIPNIISLEINFSDIWSKKDILNTNKSEIIQIHELLAHIGGLAYFSINLDERLDRLFSITKSHEPLGMETIVEILDTKDGFEVCINP